MLILLSILSGVFFIGMVTFAALYVSYVKWSQELFDKLYDEMMRNNNE